MQYPFKRRSGTAAEDSGDCQSEIAKSMGCRRRCHIGRAGGVLRLFRGEGALGGA